MRYSLLVTLTLGIFSLTGAQVATRGANTGDLIYPEEGTVWHVGEEVNVIFKEKQSPNETVAIFFDTHREGLLAGGPITNRKFSFVVPKEALSKSGSSSLLLAVHREDFHLKSVDSVNIKVLP